MGFYGLQIKSEKVIYPLYDLTSLLRCTIELFSQFDGVVPVQEMRGLKFNPTLWPF
jgi:hypothetical protein